MPEVEGIFYPETFVPSSQARQNHGSPDEPRANNRVTQKRGASVNHCSYSFFFTTRGQRSSNDSQLIFGLADISGVCAQDTGDCRDKLATQRRKRSDHVGSDAFFRRRLDPHRFDIVGDDADHVGILDLEGCKSGMCMESVLKHFKQVN